MSLPSSLAIFRGFWSRVERLFLSCHKEFRMSALKGPQRLPPVLHHSHPGVCLMPECPGHKRDVPTITSLPGRFPSGLVQDRPSGSKCCNPTTFQSSDSSVFSWGEWRKDFPHCLLSWLLGKPLCSHVSAFILPHRFQHMLLPPAEGRLHSLQHLCIWSVQNGAVRPDLQDRNEVTRWPGHHLLWLVTSMC